jgi:hypothetical protein
MPPHSMPFRRPETPCYIPRRPVSVNNPAVSDGPGRASRGAAFGALRGLPRSPRRPCGQIRRGAPSGRGLAPRACGPCGPALRREPEAGPGRYGRGLQGVASGGMGLQGRPRPARSRPATLFK